MAKQWRIQLDIETKDDAVIQSALPKNNLLLKNIATEYPDIPGVKTYDFVFKTKLEVDKFFENFKTFVSTKGVKGRLKLHSCEHSNDENVVGFNCQSSDYKLITF